MIKLERHFGSGTSELLDYVQSSRNTLVYSTPRFMHLVSHHLGSQPGWLIAKRNGTIVGALPFMKKEGPLGAVYNSLAYYGSNGGVIQSQVDDEAKAMLMGEFYNMAKAHKSISATIITNPLEQDAAFYHQHIAYDLIDERIGQITHFPSNLKPEELIKVFQDPRPRNIRRAMREEITVEPCQDQNAIIFLLETHISNMTAIGGLAKKKDFFENIPKVMEQGDWAIYLGKKDNKPVAALLLFYFNQTVEYFTPVVLTEFRSTQALSLVIYTAMQDAMSAGFSNWNWGGTWLSQSGVYDFKKRWGTSEYPYYYFTKVFNLDVRKQSKKTLLNQYSGFYVLPFTALDEAKEFCQR